MTLYAVIDRDAWRKTKRCYTPLNPHPHPQGLTWLLSDRALDLHFDYSMLTVDTCTHVCSFCKL